LVEQNRISEQVKMTGASHLIDNYLLFCNPTQLPGLLALWTVKIHENMQFLFAFINLNKKER
jgi:hypothetical protein